MFYLQSEVEKKEDEIVDLSTTGFTYNDTHYDFAMKSSNNNPRVEYVFKNGQSLLFLQQNGLYRHNFYIKLVDFKNNKELICDSLLVSIANGYVFEKDNEFIVSNGVNIFNLKRCNLK